MKIERLVVSGDEWALKRHQVLVEALREHIPHVEPVAAGTYYQRNLLGLIQLVATRVMHRRKDDGGRWLGMLYKTRRAFMNRSLDTLKMIESRPNRPDHVLHIHAMYVPAFPGRKSSTRYSIFTDYTGQLSRNWPGWLPRTERDQADWKECQRFAYENALNVFTFSDVTRDSVVNDYGVPADKVITVGHAADTRQAFTGEKPFGSKLLLINGSDWLRKGGDIAVEAMGPVLEKIPDAKLVVIGCSPREAAPGVEYRGMIRDRDELHKLFLDTDIVLSPARCDPLPTFVLETMSYGVPAIVSDRDGMPEMIAYGECGSVVPLESAALARETVALLGDEALLRRKSEAARRRIREVYNWDRIASLMTKAWSAG